MEVGVLKRFQPGSSHRFFVVSNREEAFTKERGARDGVKKVMVIVTDGESHDFYNLNSVVEKCDEDDIERFGIAVSMQLPAGGLCHVEAFSELSHEMYLFSRRTCH